MFLPRLAGLSIKSLCIYFKVAPFAPYFTKNKKYYVYNFCCINIVIWSAMCTFLTSKNVSKIILDALVEFNSKDKYERKMLNRLKRNFKRKISVSSFCLMSQVLFFFGASRWTNLFILRKVKLKGHFQKHK